MGKPCARVRDKGATHCSAFTIAKGSTTVMVNNRGVARKGDPSTTHLRPKGSKCVPHVSKIDKGSKTVMANNKMVARQGDKFSKCTLIASGSKNVIIGG